MDFEKALRLLLDGFDARGIRCAAIGGFALFKMSERLASFRARFPDA